MCLKSHCIVKVELYTALALSYPAVPLEREKAFPGSLGNSLAELIIVASGNILCYLLQAELD